MNGIQMADVEEELLCNLTWICSSLSLWITLQLPNLSTVLENQFKYRLDISQIPAINTTQSSLYQLDYMSGNISVLKSQQSNGKILSSLASVQCFVEQYLCDFVPLITLALDTPCSKWDVESEILVGTVARFLGLKSCLSLSSSTNLFHNKITIQPSHIHLILTVAAKTVEIAATPITFSEHNTQVKNNIRMATVGLQVDTIANLVLAFELLFASILRQFSQSQEKILKTYFENFEMTSEGLDMIESNKWQMMMTLQSLSIILSQEVMSCPQRFEIKKQLDGLISIVQNALIGSEVGLTSASTISTSAESSGNSVANTFNNLFDHPSITFMGGAGDGHLDILDQFPPSHPRRYSQGQYQYYTYDSHPHHQKQKQQPQHLSPISPHYFSIPFSDVDEISSHPIFNPFQQHRSQPQITTPTSKNSASTSSMMFNNDGNNTLPSLSPTIERKGYTSDPFDNGISPDTLNSVSLYSQHERPKVFSPTIKTEAPMVHYSAIDSAILSNSPYPTTNEFLHSEYK